MTFSAVNDNAVPVTSACPYGPLGVVVIHDPDIAAHPYRRFTRLPGVTVEDGFASLRQASVGRAARTVPDTRAFGA